MTTYLVAKTGGCTDHTVSVPSLAALATCNPSHQHPTSAQHTFEHLTFHHQIFTTTTTKPPLQPQQRHLFHLALLVLGFLPIQRYYVFGCKSTIFDCQLALISSTLTSAFLLSWYLCTWPLTFLRIGYAALKALSRSSNIKLLFLTSDNNFLLTTSFG